MGRRHGRHGQGHRQRAQGQVRAGRGRRLRRGRAVAAGRQGRHELRPAGDAAALDRHRLRRSDLLDRVGDGEQSQLQGPRLGRLQQGRRQGRRHDRHVRRAAAAQDGAQGDARRVQVGGRDRARRFVGPRRRLHHDGAELDGRQVQEPGPRRLRQSDAARGAAGLYRPAPRGRCALAEIPQPLGGVEHPARPQRGAHEGGAGQREGLEIPSTVSFSPN